MYTTCLFCARPFGVNDSIELFPIGRRLAFDETKGRLWVVCAHCTRWCLVPLDERWEAIESCERAFRNSRTRVSTGQIGLAKLPGGLELVRLGAPLRPELAAWRCGREFTTRRRRTIARALTVAGLGVGGGAAGMAAGVGGAAVRATTRLLARANGAGASADTTQSAAASLGTGSDVTAVLRTIARRAESANRAHKRGIQKLNAELEAASAGNSYEAGAFMLTDAFRNAHLNPASLALMPAVDRLAFEMALYEERERLAMEGELAPLLAAWEEADQIAAIADGLLVPAAVSEKLASLQSERSQRR